MMNLILMRAGYPPATVRVEDRLIYYDALDTVHAGDTELLVRLMAQAVDRSLDTWLVAARSGNDE